MRRTARRKMGRSITSDIVKKLVRGNEVTQFEIFTMFLRRTPVEELVRFAKREYDATFMRHNVANPKLEDEDLSRLKLKGAKFLTRVFLANLRRRGYPMALGKYSMIKVKTKFFDRTEWCLLPRKSVRAPAPTSVTA